MPGNWDPANPPYRPGSYTRFLARAQERPNPPLTGVVAIPIVHDWGPFKEFKELNSLGEFRRFYGDSVDTAGYRAVYQAFKGEGIEGRGGAAQVLCHRTGGSAAAKAFKNLANTNGTPVATALVLTAKYEGTKGHDINVAVVADAVSPTTVHNLVIYVGSLEVERYAYPKSDITNVGAQVNASSTWVTAVVNSTTDPLALVAAAPLTGGNDGTTLVAQDWTDLLAAFGQRRFGVFVPYDLTDDAIHTSIKAWAADPATGLNSKGKRFEVVLGGGTIGTPDTLSAALVRSDALNDPNIVNVGGFRARDSRILDPATGDPLELTPSTIAPRLAGIIAARGVSASATFARLSDVEIITGLSTDNEFITAGEGGVMTLAVDSHRDAPTRIEMGVTTYQDDPEDKPKYIYSVLKFVRSMHRIEMMITEFAEWNVIGRLGVSPDSREYLVGQVQKMMSELVTEGAIQEVFEVYISQDPPPTDLDDFISIVYEVTLGRDVEQVRNTVVVR